MCTHNYAHICVGISFPKKKTNLTAFPAGKHLDAHPTARCGDAKPAKRYPWTCQNKTAYSCYIQKYEIYTHYRRDSLHYIYIYMYVYAILIHFSILQQHPLGVYRS